MKSKNNIIKNSNEHTQLIINSLSIMVCTEPVDLRKSIDGLVELVMKNYKLDPYKTTFIFLNNTRTKIKILAWHNNGFCVLYKKLEKGHKFFNVTKKNNKPVTVTKEQLSWIIAGLDWVNMSAWGELEYKDFS